MISPKQCTYKLNVFMLSWIVAVLINDIISWNSIYRSMLYVLSYNLVSGHVNMTMYLFMCMYMFVCLCPCIYTALVCSGPGQRAVCDLHGELWSGCVGGSAGQRAGSSVPLHQLWEHLWGGRGTCCSQDARRYSKYYHWFVLILMCWYDIVSVVTAIHMDLNGGCTT